MGLRRQGWALEVLPKGGRAAHLPSYMPLDDQPRKLWYVRSAEKNFHRGYLLCLSARREFWQTCGVQDIKHLRKAPYYTFLWEGKPEQALLALEGRPQCQPAGCLEDGDADAASEAEQTLDADSDDAADQDSDAAAEPPLHPAPLEDDLFEDLVPCPAAAADDLTAFGGNGEIGEAAGSDVDDSRSSKTTDSSKSEDSSMSSTSSRQSSSKSSSSSKAVVRRHVITREHGREQNGRWVDSVGQGFRWSFTPRDPSPRGSYTITCPHHKEGKKSCTRTRSWRTSEERQAIIWQLMQWCIMATRHGVGSKRQHMELPINDNRMQKPSEIVEAARSRGFDVDPAAADPWSPLGVVWDEEAWLPKQSISICFIFKNSEGRNRYPFKRHTESCKP
jgi:hypothetical protein